MASTAPFVQRYSSVLVVLLGLLIYAANTVRLHERAWDDAYITFRFAQHLADGQGLTWNQGGERVEGFSSFLHVLVLAGARRAGFDLETFALALSIAATLATALVMLWTFRRWSGSVPLAAALPLALYLSDDLAAIHSTSRLETPLFLLLLSLSIGIAIRLTEAPRLGTAAGLAVTTWLATLCRPEGAVYGVAVYLVLLARGTLARDGPVRGLRRRTAMSLGIAIGLTAAYAAWKYAYFGYLLPNPYYVKSNRLSLDGLSKVGSFLEHETWRLGPPMLAVALLAATSGRLLATLRRSAGTVALIVFPAVFALGFYATILHEVGGAHRFSYPTLVHISLGAGFISLAFGTQLLANTAAGRGWLSHSLAVLAAVAWLFVVSPPGFDFRTMGRGAFMDYHWRIAEALRSTGLGPRATVLTDAAGVIPYLSGFKHVDRVGLTDNYLSGRIARRPAEKEAYVWGLSRDVYIGYEPPATVGSEFASEDPMMRTPYVAGVLLSRPLIGVEERIFLRDPDLLHQRMRELRDNWTWIGEIDWPGWELWRLKSFAYVHHGADPKLRAALAGIVTRPAGEVVLDDVPWRPTAHGVLR